MSAPTPAPGDTSPRAGYYPDPSIPGYVRYWNGVAWVPGTSRPAPSEGESMPAPPAGSSPSLSSVPSQQGPRADETGPMFFDEEPAGGGSAPDSAAGGAAVGGSAAGVPAAGGFVAPEPADSVPSTSAAPPASSGPEDQPGARPEPASAWQADAGRQSGFGGEQDRRVSWGAPAGSGQDPRVVADAAPAATPAPSAPPADAPSAPAAPAAPEDAPADGTMTMRAARPRTGESAGATPQGPSHRTDGTMAIRRVDPTAAGPQSAAPQSAAPSAPAAQPVAPQAPATPSPAPSQPAAPAPQSAAPAPAAPQAQPASPAAPRPAYGYPQSAAAPAAPQPATPAAPQAPAPAAPQSAAGSPLTPGAGGGSASWAQQVHQLAQPPAGEGQQAAPFKPVVEDPFLAAARAQASARPAGLGKRLAARLVDTLVVGGLTAAAAVPLVPKALDHIDGKIDEAKMSGLKTTVWLLDGTTALYAGIILGVLLLAGLLCEALPTAKWGRTLGKKLLGIEVRDIEEHDAPSFGAAVKRWLVYTVPGLLVIGVVGVLWCLFDRPWRQCWHDKAARTFVAG